MFVDYQGLPSHGHLKQSSHAIQSNIALMFIICFNLWYLSFEFNVSIILYKILLYYFKIIMLYVLNILLIKFKHYSNFFFAVQGTDLWKQRAKLYRFRRSWCYINVSLDMFDYSINRI